MRKFAKHENILPCPGCVDRLTDADGALAGWFHSRRNAQPAIELPMHVSWAFRDEQSQNEAVANHESKLPWPDSKHNVMINGKPCSQALDIFQINEDNQAIFDPIFCTKLYYSSVRDLFRLRWGGEFKSLGDFGHFELFPK